MHRPSQRSVLGRPSRLSRRTKARVTRSAALAAAPLALAMLPSISSAALVTLTASDTTNGSSTSFNSAGHWSNSAAPTSGNTYSVLGNFTIRGPNNSISYVFGGDSLTIGNGTFTYSNSNGSHTGAVFLGKATGTTQVLTVGNLTLDAGLLEEANSINDGDSMTIAGNISVTAYSYLDANQGESLIVASAISGSSGLQLGGNVNGNGNNGTVIFTNSNTNYSGNITLGDSNTSYPIVLQVGNSTASGGLGSGTVTIGANSTLALMNTANPVANAISGAGVVTQIGTGFTTVLSGSNTYSGNTTVTAGTLKFAQEVSLYGNTTSSWTAANILVNSGGTVAFNVGGTGQFTTADVTTLLTNLDGAVSNNGLKAGSTIGFDTTNAAGGNLQFPT